MAYNTTCKGNLAYKHSLYLSRVSHCVSSAFHKLLHFFRPCSPVFVRKMVADIENALHESDQETFIAYWLTNQRLFISDSQIQQQVHEFILVKCVILPSIILIRSRWCTVNALLVVTNVGWGSDSFAFNFIPKFFPGFFGKKEAS